MKNARTRLKGISHCWQDYNSCQVYSHPESETLRICGLVSVQRFDFAKYTKHIKRKAVQVTQAINGTN